MKGKRTGELRVMNSANILILFAALRVPDAASHASLDPLEIDLASLAFSQGHDAARGGRSEPLGPSSIEVSNP